MSIPIAPYKSLKTQRILLADQTRPTSYTWREGNKHGAAGDASLECDGGAAGLDGEGSGDPEIRGTEKAGEQAGKADVAAVAAADVAVAGEGDGEAEIDAFGAGLVDGQGRTSRRTLSVVNAGEGVLLAELDRENLAGDAGIVDLAVLHFGLHVLDAGAGEDIGGGVVGGGEGDFEVVVAVEGERLAGPIEGKCDEGGVGAGDAAQDTGGSVVRTGGCAEGERGAGGRLRCGDDELAIPARDGGGAGGRGEPGGLRDGDAGGAFG